MNEQPGGTLEEDENPDERPRRRGLTPKGIAITALAGILVGVAAIGVLILVGPGNGGSDHPDTTIPPAVDQSPPAQVAASGSIEVDADQVDLGPVPLGQEVTAEWVVRNVGTTPLVIQRLGPTRVVQGCCPTQPEISSMEIAPGESATVSLSMMMHEGMGGPHLFEIPVYSSDPDQTQYVLKVTADFV